ncbi:MAG: protein jag, partial [Spirochaetae bacterium HGW-Spirochaetae-6]
LEAIQSLAYMIANNDEAHWKRIIVDVDGYRRKKEDKTREMIEDIAYNVRRSRKPYLTPLYSASERRIIHMVIQEIDGVSSESEGEGMYKRVWIRPE